MQAEDNEHSTARKRSLPVPEKFKIMSQVFSDLATNFGEYKVHPFLKGRKVASIAILSSK